MNDNNKIYFYKYNKENSDNNAEKIENKKLE